MPLTIDLYRPASLACSGSAHTHSKRLNYGLIFGYMPFVVGILSYAGLTMPCHAQVTMHNQALDALGPPPTKPSPTAPSSSVRPHHQSPNSSSKRSTSSSVGHTSAPAPMAAPQPPLGHPAMAIVPAIPQAAPPPPVFQAPVINVPLHPEPLPPLPQVDDKSTGSAHIIANVPHAIRLLYPANNTNLNTPMMKAVEAFAAALRTHPGMRALVNAYSSGVPTDLSTPRRTAFMRGLAVRAVLVNAGIATTHVYVRAVGLPNPQENKASPDRVDLFFSDIIPPADDNKGNQPAKTSSTDNTPPSSNGNGASSSPSSASSPSRH